jgi:hypothetical protein
LKYLGQTGLDPFKYYGSGIDWKQHLKIHGKDIHTEILLQTTDREELNKLGRHYSKLWNIVGAMDDFGNKIWANRIPETGGGSGDQVKKSWENTDTRNRRIEGMKKIWSDQEYKERVLATVKETLNRPEVREKLRKSKNTEKAKAQIAKFITDEQIKEKRQKSLKKIWEDGSHKAACLKGEENPNYNHIVYDFIHVDGRLEKCTMYSLYKTYKLNRGNLRSVIDGNRKSCGGWMMYNVIEEN